MSQHLEICLLSFQLQEKADLETVMRWANLRQCKGSQTINDVTMNKDKDGNPTCSSLRSWSTLQISNQSRLVEAQQLPTHTHTTTEASVQKLRNGRSCVCGYFSIFGFELQTCRKTPSVGHSPRRWEAHQQPALLACCQVGKPELDNYWNASKGWTSIAQSEQRIF